MRHAVVAGGSSARVLDLTGAEIKDIPAESVELPIGQTVFSVAWSPDGQLLTVSTTVRGFSVFSLSHACSVQLHKLPCNMEESGTGCG